MSLISTAEKKKALKKSNGHAPVEKIIKIDCGCGKNKRGADWIGIDVIDFEGVDKVLNLVASISERIEEINVFIS